MTTETENQLQEFRYEQSDLFDENGKAFTNVYPFSAMERMLNLIDLLEKELTNK
jgi:hypothetical protein